VHISKFFKSFAFLLSLVATANVFAAGPEEKSPSCSCEVVPWQEVFDASTHVVFGQIKIVEKHSDELATGAFQMHEVFKGEGQHVKKLVGSSKESASCRQVLEPGFYIVYTQDAQNVVLNSCVASRQLKDDLVSTLSKIKKYAESKTAYRQDDTGQHERGVKQSNSDSKQADESVEESDWLQMIIDWFG
jgi:hypothetical protein